MSRLSWFPTPESFNARRKGNLGHWTGKMEDSWNHHISEIESSYRPLNAGTYAKWSFGSLGKYIWEMVEEASRVIVA